MSVLLRNTTLGIDIPINDWETFTISILFVLSNFMKNLLNAKSIELKSDSLSEQVYGTSVFVVYTQGSPKITQTLNRHFSSTTVAALNNNNHIAPLYVVPRR